LDGFGLFVDAVIGHAGGGAVASLDWDGGLGVHQKLQKLNPDIFY
jgi:hypothetical protein